MSDWRDDPRATRLLRLTAVAYAVAIAVHVGDHLRRGFDASPRLVLTLGTLTIALQGLVIAAALTRRAVAPLLAVAVGVGDGIGVVIVHLLPRWSVLSDPFPGADAAPGVTAFSWITALVQIGTGLAFAWAGWVALTYAARRGTASPA